MKWLSLRKCVAMQLNIMGNHSTQCKLKSRNFMTNEGAKKKEELISVKLSVLM